MKLQTRRPVSTVPLHPESPKMQVSESAASYYSLSVFILTFSGSRSKRETRHCYRTFAGLVWVGARIQESVADQRRLWSFVNTTLIFRSLYFCENMTVILSEGAIEVRIRPQHYFNRCRPKHAKLVNVSQQDFLRFRIVTVSEIKSKKLTLPSVYSAHPFR